MFLDLGKLLLEYRNVLVSQKYLLLHLFKLHPVLVFDESDMLRESLQNLSWRFLLSLNVHLRLQNDVLAALCKLKSTH